MRSGRSALETVLSACLTLAALVIAGTLVHRELRSSTPVGTSATLSVEREDRWSEILDAARLAEPDAREMVIVQFGDFECPFCRRLHFATSKLRTSSSVGLREGIVHFPLRSHRNAFDAARAAECARGQDRFHDFSNTLFQHQDSIGVTAWEDLAARSGVPSVDLFSACLRDGLTRSTVERGRSLGVALGVDATPTVFINGFRLSRPPNEAELDRIAKLISAGRDLESELR